MRVAGQVEAKPIEVLVVFLDLPSMTYKGSEIGKSASPGVHTVPEPSINTPAALSGALDPIAVPQMKFLRREIRFLPHIWGIN